MAEHYDYIVRSTEGVNAGHTVYVNVIGNGCVMHIPIFWDELKVLKENGINVDVRVFIPTAPISFLNNTKSSTEYRKTVEEKTKSARRGVE